MHTKIEDETQGQETKSSGYKWIVFGVMFAIMGIVLGANWMVMPVLFTQMSETTGIALSTFQTIWALIPLGGILICLDDHGTLGVVRVQARDNGAHRAWIHRAPIHPDVTVGGYSDEYVDVLLL